ncbi:MAG: hypothetical protein LBT11_03555 [Treponema sp.]|jgi:vacuolar-type H+-ATPase subunit H|nr:hypothetical protein [Treponema sp.]
MDDQNILQHLLEIEGQAEALVNDAQTEADRRVQEAEKEHRAVYEERYAREIAAQEAQYREEFAGMEERYRRTLEEYRSGLDREPADRGKFSALAAGLLRLA